MTPPNITPLQWAVLLYYSHTLPKGPEYDRVRLLVAAGRPVRCGPALTLAEETGLVRTGKITALGKAAAQLALETLGGGQ